MNHSTYFNIVKKLNNTYTDVGIYEVAAFSIFKIIVTENCEHAKKKKKSLTDVFCHIAVV